MSGQVSVAELVFDVTARRKRNIAAAQRQKSHLSSHFFFFTALKKYIKYIWALINGRWGGVFSFFHSNFSSCLSDRGIFISYYLIYSLGQFFTGRQWWWWMFPIKPRSSHSLVIFLETTRLPNMQFFTFSFWVFPVSRLRDTENAKQPRVSLRRGANKTLINDSGTFWSLIDRIGTTQRLSSTTFIYLGGSLFQREDQTKKMWKAAAASPSTPIGRINSGTKTL